MHSTAHKCLTWSIGLFVLGTLVMVWGSDAYIALANRAGANAQAGLVIMDHVFTFTRNAVFPLGAALLGAAVVIQTLSAERTDPLQHSQ